MCYSPHTLEQKAFASASGNVIRGVTLVNMSKFKLQQDVFTQTTRIPNCFIEKYMPKAAGEFVKIYIYLLKCVEENRAELSTAKIADALEDSEKDVIRALKYWAKKGLLKLEFDEDNTLTSLRMTSFAEMNDESEIIPVHVSGKAPAAKAAQPAAAKEEASAAETKAAPEEEAEAAPQSPVRKQYSPQEIADFSEKDEITLLLYSIQKYIGHPLSGADLNTVLFFYDTLQLTADAIEYLFEYCVSKGHKSMRYIEKTAIGWAEQGATTLKAAKTLNGIYSDQCYPVLRAFGLTGRKPSRGESDYVSRWTLSYGFTMELILEAVNRTMNSIHQPSFEYADSILRRWKSSGVRTLEEVKAMDEKREASIAEASAKAKKGASAKGKSSSAAKFNNFDQREYDYSELEEKLFNV